MEQYQLVWPQEASPLARRGLLLLVEVAPAEAETAQGQRAMPCRVLGTISPGMAPLPSPAPSQEDHPARLLAAIGVPANLLGCGYLRTALTLVCDHPEMRRGLMRTLYPQVAQHHGVTPRSVERAIRHAIEQTWARGGGERFRQLLGRMGSSIGDRPTNGEFLSLLADHLTMDRNIPKSRHKW